MALETQEEMALSCLGAHLAGWPKGMTAEMHQDARFSSGRMMATVNRELFPEEDHIGMPYAYHAWRSFFTFSSGTFVGALCK